MNSISPCTPCHSLAAQHYRSASTVSAFVSPVTVYRKSKIEALSGSTSRRLSFPQPQGRSALTCRPHFIPTRCTAAPVLPKEIRSEFKSHKLLETFYIGEDHLRSHAQRVHTGRAIVDAMQRDGIINIAMDGVCSPDVVHNAFAVQKVFFDSPKSKKASLVSDYSYGGYVYSGEEDTAGNRDAAEIFTVMPDFSQDHPLVKQDIPCHGPVPWPSDSFREHMTKYMAAVRSIGDRVLPLIALGLGMEENVFDELTKESWGHMRVLKFRERTSTQLNGIGSHTDYGMLVIAAQDDVGGLWVRPMNGEERKNNWEESSAGAFQDDDGWKFVVPEPNVLTCFPGDMLQFITRNQLMSTPHKVELANKVRYSLAYFHEPSFGAVIRREDTGESVHYGEHFTNMFMRCYPQKGVTRRIVDQGLKEKLSSSVTGTYSY